MQDHLTFYQACSDLVYATRSLLWQYTPENIFVLDWLVGMITAFLMFLAFKG